MNRFINMASTGNNSVLWYMFTICAVILGYALGQVPLGMFISAKLRAASITNTDVFEFENTLDFSFLGMQSWQGLIFLLGSSIFALVALVICTRLIHSRTVKSLITWRNRVDWRKLIFAFTCWLLLSGVAELIMYFNSPGSYVFRLDWNDWLPLVATGLVLIPLQTSFEELFVRGYLLQGIGLGTRSGIMAILITSLLFAAVHLGNPEIKQFGTGIMMSYYFIVAVCLALFTLMDEGLEYALGIHAATNVYGAVFVGFKGSVLQTDTMFVTTEMNAIVMLILFVAMMVVFYVLAKNIFGFRPVPLLRFNTNTPIVEYNDQEHTD